VRILVVGAGAVGGYFGARLIQAGVDAAFLVRPARAESLAGMGLALVEPDGSRETVAVRALTVTQLDEPWDVVLVAVKGSSLEGAMDDIAPAVGDSTVVLPLLNGMGHLAQLVDRFGAGRVLGGVCEVATEPAPDGAIRHLVPGGMIRFGELDGSSSTRVVGIAQTFAPARFASRTSETIVQDMWEKWLFMASGGAVGVLLGGSVGDIAVVRGGPAAEGRIVDEALAVLEAAGHTARADAAARVRSVLTADGSPFTTSLFRDFRAGRPTEGEAVIGDFVDVAEQHGVAVPLLAAAAVRLRVASTGRGGQA